MPRFEIKCEHIGNVPGCTIAAGSIRLFLNFRSRKAAWARAESMIFLPGVWECSLKQGEFSAVRRYRLNKYGETPEFIL